MELGDVTPPLLEKTVSTIGYLALFDIMYDNKSKCDH